MNVNHFTSTNSPGYPDHVEPKDQRPGWGQPWISSTRCRERFNQLVTQWIAPRLQSLQCHGVVLVPVLDGGLSLYTEVDQYLDRHEELAGLERHFLPIRVRSAHGGEKFEIIPYPSHHKLVEGRVVLILDDIADTGQTLDSVLAYVRGWGPAEVMSFTFLAKPRTSRRPDFACFCVPNDLLLVGWGMDAGTGTGRREEAIWDAADYIQQSSARHQMVGAEMIRFAHSVGNSTLAETIRRLATQGNWQGQPDILEILAEYF